MSITDKPNHIERCSFRGNDFPQIALQSNFQTHAFQESVSLDLRCFRRQQQQQQQQQRQRSVLLNNCHCSCTRPPKDTFLLASICMPSTIAILDILKRKKFCFLEISRHLKPPKNLSELYNFRFLLGNYYHYIVLPMLHSFSFFSFLFLFQTQPMKEGAIPLHI